MFNQCYCCYSKPILDVADNKFAESAAVLMLKDDLMTFPHFLPFPWVEMGDTSTMAPSSHFARGGGGGGWLGPSSFSVLAGAQVGAGDEGQPLHMTTYITSQANIPETLHPKRS